jgi:hypothetical protein
MYKPLDFLEKENDGFPGGGVADIEISEGWIVIDEFKGCQDQYF